MFDPSDRLTTETRLAVDRFYSKYDSITDKITIEADKAAQVNMRQRRNTKAITTDKRLTDLCGNIKPLVCDVLVQMVMHHHKNDVLPMIVDKCKPRWQADIKRNHQKDNYNSNLIYRKAMVATHNLTTYRSAQAHIAQTEKQRKAVDDGRMYIF